MPAGQLCQELLTAIFDEILDAPAVPDSPSRNSPAPFLTKRFASPHANLNSAAQVCRSWNAAATKALYSDPGQAISRYEGLYLPHLITALRNDSFLRASVRSLTIENTLEAGLWISDRDAEGDLFCDLLELCPNLRAVTVPSFEVSCRERITSALRNCSRMESFNIRVYLESSRRDPRFAKLIPYDSWSLQFVTDIVSHWPKLKQVTVRHVPAQSYHLIPDVVMRPPQELPYTLPTLTAKLTTLTLRETFIDDQGLFHLINGSALTSLCIMSCQGITSSAITRNGLLKALQQCGPSLKHLKVMTPWLPHSAGAGEHDLVVDLGLKACTALRTLCVAGYSVTNAFLKNLPHPELLDTLEIMDFELVTPQAVYEVTKKGTRFTSLKRLAVWQRNAGVGRERVSNGWFRAAFAKPESPVISALNARGIKLATGWESRLISGEDIDYHDPELTHEVFEEVDRLSPV